MAQEHLDLLKLPTSSPAQLGARAMIMPGFGIAAEIVRCDARNACCRSVPLEQLPHHLFAHSMIVSLITPAHPAQDRTFGDPRRRGPRVDCDLHPGRHRDGVHSPVLADEVNDCPAVVALLDVLHRQRRHLRPAQPAAEQDGQHRAVAQPLVGGYVRRVQEFLGLLDRQPVADPHADELRALQARDTGGQFGCQKTVVGRFDSQLPLLLTYTITKADEKGPFLPIPADTQEKAKMKWLGFETSQEELGETFHSSPTLLAELNPDKKLDAVGERITVPTVRRAAVRVALRVVVSKSKRTVIAYGAGDKELAQYPATIGDTHDPLPIGQWTITSVLHYPWFNYDPEHFWNSDPKQAKAVLPPGPNSPAGAAWIGLSKEHYGIHGTPDPGHIRHGESAGCIRMTNWDVDELSHMVRRGTPVVLEE